MDQTHFSCGTSRFDKGIKLERCPAHGAPFGCDQAMAARKEREGLASTLPAPVVQDEPFPMEATSPEIPKAKGLTKKRSYE